MDALETLVHETLAEHAADAPSDDGLLATVTQAPRRRPWLAGGLAAALVLGIAAGALALRSSRHHDIASPTQQAAGVAAPAGYRWLGFRNIAIAVPIELPVRNNECVPPARYILVHTWRSPMGSCIAGGLPEEQQTLTVRLDSYRTVVGPGRPRVTREISLHGFVGRIGYGKTRPFPGVAGRLKLPDQRVSISVTAPTRSTVDAILRSIHPIADLLGCSARVSVSAGPRMLPGRPTSATACVYSAPKAVGSTPHLLVDARKLSGPKLTEVIRAEQILVGQTTLVNPSAPLVALTVRYADRPDQEVRVLSADIARLVASP
jgi:hypothetical protein